MKYMHISVLSKGNKRGAIELLFFFKYFINFFKENPARLYLVQGFPFPVALAI